MENWAAAETDGVGWLFTWAATPNDTYEIWHDGFLLDTVTPDTIAGEYAFGLDGYAASPPAVEIHNTASGKAQNEDYPTFAVIQWRGLVEASGYVVQRNNGIWVTVGDVTERGLGWYSYNTQVLADDLDVNFRVMALDAKGTEGAALGFTVHLVRNPSMPSVEYVVNAGNLEIGAA